MSSFKVAGLWVLSLIVTFTVGYFTENKFASDPKNQEEIIRKNFSYKYINPILECNVDLELNNKLDSLKNNVQDIIQDQINQKNITFASVYYRDLNNGPWFGINEDEYFSPASLVKVPVMIAYLKKAETDPLILQKKIVNTPNIQDGSNIQNIKPSVSIAPNQSYTVEDLINKMIINSDNDSYNTLAENLDQNELADIYQDLDVDISKAFTNPNGNIITVKDYASFFRILFNASYLNKDMSELALSILTQTDYKDGLVAGTPNNITIAHKFGERKYLDTGETQFHDCGIIYLPQKPYLLCIMTKGTDFNHLSQVIQEISSTVYQNLTKN